jgi:glycosyltransferase involved in cell wall biosynthesis
LAERGHKVTIATFYSGGVGFPNVVAEGDLGDARAIVADFGWVVAPNDPGAMAAALTSAISAVHPEQCETRRQRIAQRFSVGTLIRNTEKAISHLVEAW